MKMNWIVLVLSICYAIPFIWFLQRTENVWEMVVATFYLALIGLAFVISLGNLLDYEEDENEKSDEVF